MLLTFPVAFWSWGICSPSKQFSMYHGSSLLREVQLNVIEIEISGPSQENHSTAPPKAPGRKAGTRLPEHWRLKRVSGAWSGQCHDWLEQRWLRWQDCDVQWPPVKLATPSSATGPHHNTLCNRRGKIYTEKWPQAWHCSSNAGVLNWVLLPWASDWSLLASWAVPSAAGAWHQMLHRCVLNALDLWSLRDLITAAKKSNHLTPPCPSAGIYHSASTADRREFIQPTALRFITWWITVNYKLITVKSSSAAAAKSHRDNESACLVSLPLFLICSE